MLMLICLLTRRRATLSLLATILFAAGLFSSSSAVALTMDTTPSWDGTTNVCCFGETNTATYGQTITADTIATQLDSFTFYLNDRLDTDFTDLRAYAYSWNGSHATGPELFGSTTISTTNNGGSDGFEAIGVSTGGIQLVAGQQYVLFLSASQVFDGERGTSSWASVNPGGSGTSTIPGGSFVFRNNTDNFGDLFTPGWAIRSGDLAFRAEFSTPIPEPGTALLVSLGLAALSSNGRSRRV